MDGGMDEHVILYTIYHTYIPKYIRSLDVNVYKLYSLYSIYINYINCLDIPVSMGSIDLPQSNPKWATNGATGQ